jgi:spore coat polysaccharide biosynthesis predicted glycosyltransferase SpsG
VADNQRHGVAEAARRGVVRSLGWHADVTPDQVVRALAALASDPAARAALAAAGRALVDGRGAERVVSAMLGTEPPAARAASEHGS